MPLPPWARFRTVVLLFSLSCVFFTSLASAQNGGSNDDENDDTDTTTQNSTADCSCGFVDPTTDRFYTDSIITYFNETSSIPERVFTINEFENKYERGWYTYYREGAVPENAYFVDGHEWPQESWLNLNVSGCTPEHLCNGAELQTVRKDILYGTFRVYMKSPGAYAGGSALTMRLQYNETESAELDLLNMDDSAEMANVQTVLANQDPELGSGFNYTDLESDGYDNLEPWQFLDYRIDWTEEAVEWYAGGQRLRTAFSENSSVPVKPLSFYVKHWSNGNENWMEGPPEEDTSGSVGWVRAFFNSSINEASSLPSNCRAAQRCSTEDWSLRVTTDYTERQTLAWDPVRDAEEPGNQTVGILFIAISLAITAALLIHLALRKLFVKKSNVSGSGSGGPINDVELQKMKNHAASASTAALLTSPGQGAPPFMGAQGRSVSQRPLLGQGNHYDSYASSRAPLQPGQMPPAQYNQQNPFATPQQTPYGERNDPMAPAMAASMAAPMAAAYAQHSSLTDPNVPGTQNPDLASTGQQGTAAAATEQKAEGAVAAANPGAKPAAITPPRMRVDYLAGLVAICSLLVSCTHFILTFTPSVIMEYLPQHYNSEYWARRTIMPFFFNGVWVGLFFTTSTRFLITGYLRNGNLNGIAEKIVCRTPRLMIPITAVILLEYFLMDLGAVTYLEYIPSVTWSTWPSTSVFNNFGWFINQTLQIIYIIPNAAPQLTWNFCTGVLWTIPVQLQNSWLVFMGVVIIREIKTPWKRFGYYTFCILNHWYALSWGSYFWFGLMLADLDITYKYKKSIQSHFYLHYPLLTLASVMVIMSLATELFSVWTGYSFNTEERNIHPEIMSGLNLGQTDSAGYPSYIEPKLNGLLFAVGSQYVVELSVWVQRALSVKVLIWLFPHVFTIYLIHGLVQWSIGSLVCIYFAGQSLPYWLNILLTALITYGTLFAALPIVTPVMEFLGKECTKSIWVSASTEPDPKRPTAWPFATEDVIPRVSKEERSRV